MKRILSAAVALCIAGLGAVGIASAAQAHTGDLNATAVCNTTTGEWDVTYTLTTANTGLAGETFWRVGNDTFQGTPNSNTGLDRGPIASVGAQTLTLGTISVPNTKTKAPWAYAFTTWTDGYKQGSDGGDITFRGTCATPPPTKPDVKTTYTEWVDGTWTCGDTSVVQTRTKTVIDSTLVNNVWVDSAPVVTTETNSRTLNDAEKKVAQSTNPNAECFVPPTNVCVAGQGDTSTDLNDLWANVDTRSAGHLEYVDGGLHVWTTDNSTQAKVSEGRALNFALKNTGVIGLDWAGSTPPPGVNLFVTFESGKTGTLVYESVYGQDLWLTNGSNADVKANAPVIGSGNGTQWHGTIDQWLTKYPNAVVTGVAYSLGSGVLGDGVIKSITVNCATYLFDKVDTVVVREPKVEVTYTEWTTQEVACGEDSYESTREATTTTTTYRVDVVNGAYVVVANEPTSVTTTQTRTVEVTVTPCPTPTPTVPPVTPTPTPSVTTPGPSPSASETPVVAQVTGGPTLAATGSNGLAIGLGALVLVVAGAVLLVVRRRSAQN